MNIFKKSFNDQTRDVILSYGEKFVSVQSNPFAKDALKESIDLGRIEKNNKKRLYIPEKTKVILLRRAKVRGKREKEVENE